MDGDFITVACYREPSMAELAKSKLVAEGIECELVDEQTIAINWLWSDLLGGVKVRVPEAQAAEARMLLGDGEAEVAEAIEAESAAVAEERCPRCGSLEVHHVDGKRGAGAALLLWINFIPIAPRRWSDHEACVACGAVWPPKKPAAVDELYCPLDIGPGRELRPPKNLGRWVILIAMTAIAVWMARQP